jgi:arylsulfatase B/arylsulfatase I/J
MYAGMATAMDEGIRNITELFKKHGIWDNTVLFFSTDNGGHEMNGATNDPLRDGKGTLYDGGIRGVAFAHGRGIKPATVSHGLMHISDIFPTIVHLAEPPIAQNNKTVNIPQLDGFNMWGMLTRGEKSPRQEILVNIDPLAPTYGKSQYPDIYDTTIRSAIIHDQWKLITGNPIRHGASLKKITEPNVQLYDLISDPSEKHNLASSRSDVVKSLLARLQSYNKTAVKPIFPHEQNAWAKDSVLLPFDDNPKHLV